MAVKFNDNGVEKDIYRVIFNNNGVEKEIDYINFNGTSIKVADYENHYFRIHLNRSGLLLEGQISWLIYGVPNPNDLYIDIITSLGNINGIYLDKENTYITFSEELGGTTMYDFTIRFRGTYTKEKVISLGDIPSGWSTVLDGPELYV